MSEMPLARDEAFWGEFARGFDPDDRLINLENGYFGRMSRSVLARYQQAIEQVNRSNSLYVRERFDAEEHQQIRDGLARSLGVSARCIALTRSASESLHSLIRNYNRLRPGDQVLFSDLEYDSVQSGLQWLVEQRGIELIRVVHAHPASHDSLLQAYIQLFERHPRLKLIVLTHVSHRTGLVLPVQAIACEATARGIDVLLDGAHSLGQIDFKLAELGVPFAAFNLHKWIGAPLSLGFIYVAEARLSRIDPDMADTRYPSDDIRSRAPYGTPNIPALMTLPLALEEHAALGGAAVKGARLRYLRDLWVNALRADRGIEVLTPDDPRLYCGITALRFSRQSYQQAMVEQLRDRFGIFTVLRQTVACGECIRITPALTTRPEQIAHLIAALRTLAAT
ncbi:MAG: aminotransferase class V-fold PLP-dependent enzyme [Pseudomonas sp.]|uniref:aminotransferase class V-fold PLP-dependent enzyme n=1 Tax=Pseudomonas sp. TaxID=306 RepID=UPI0033960231